MARSSPSDPFLPFTALPAAPDGIETTLRSGGREAAVLVRIHNARCDRCRLYVAQLAESGIDLAWWEGRVVILVPGSLADASTLRADAG